MPYAIVISGSHASGFVRCVRISPAAEPYLEQWAPESVTTSDRTHQSAPNQHARMFEHICTARVESWGEVREMTKSRTEHPARLPQHLPALLGRPDVVKHER